MADRFQFTDNSGRVISEIERVVMAAMEKAALIVEGQAKLLTPVDTGGLRDSIDHQVDNDDGKITGKIGSPLDYAIYQEFGTGEFAENGAGRKGGWGYTTPDGSKHFTMGTKPKKMLRTSFIKNKKRVQDILANDLGANFKGE